MNPPLASSTEAHLEAAPAERGWKRWWALVKAAASGWMDDDAASMGASLSYYTVFSLAPLLLIVIAVAGLFFGREAAQGALMGQLSGLMGADAAKTIEGILATAAKQEQSLVATVIGLAVMLVGATTVLAELQSALDRIWKAPEKPKGSGIWFLLRTRLLSFGLILGIAFLLIVSLVFGAAVAAVGDWWGSILAGWEILAQASNLLISFVLTTAAFAMIYKMMPRVKIQWHDVLLGAAVTSVLFTLGKFLISLYIGKSGVASSFGATGSIIIVFVWVYYSAQIFLLGAEFTWAYANAFGSHQGKRLDAKSSVAAPELPHPAATQAPVMLSPVPAPQNATSRAAGRELAMLGLQFAALIAIRFALPRLVARSARVSRAVPLPKSN